MTDKLIPQFELGPRIGGVKELATRLSFYNGIANSLMVAALYYGENPQIPGVGLRLHDIAPTIIAFYAILVAFAAVLAVWEHAVMVRAQAEYNQLQNFDENVSPIRQDVQEIRSEIEALREELNE